MEWARLSTSQSYKTWSGLSFETLCLKHIRQIKKALHIGGIYSTNSSWFNASAQIDLLIDRDDNVINLCEMKFYNAPYTIDKRTYLNLKNKRTEFRKDTITKKNTFIALITTYGINENKYSNEIVQNSLKIDDLFDS